MAVNLKSDGWLAAEQSSPPAAQQPLVERIEHVHDRLCRRIVTAIGHDPQAHILPSATGAQTSENQRNQTCDHVSPTPRMAAVAVWEGFVNIAQSGNSSSDPTDSAHRDGREARGLRDDGLRGSPLVLSARGLARRNSTVDSRRDDRDVVAQAARSACKRKSLESLDDRCRPSLSLVGKQAA